LSNNLILFREVNYYTFPIILIFKLLGHDVGFLSAKERFRSDKFIQYLDRKGIFQLSFERFNPKEPYDIYYKADSFSNELLKNDEADILLSKLVSIFSENEVHRKKYKITILANLIPLLNEVVTLVYFANHFNLDYKYKKISLYIENNKINEAYINDNGAFKNYFPRWIYYFNGAIFLLKKTFNLFVSLLLTIKNVFMRKLNKKGIDNGSNRVDIKKYNVAYFPYKGIWYNNLFLKDHYYDENEAGQFNKKNILHFSMADAEPYASSSIKYYDDNGIPYYDFDQIPSTAKYFLLLNIGRYLFKTIGDIRSINVKLYSVFVLSLVQITYGISRLEKLPNLKLILIGYDVLFPKYISLACALRNITTVATQERFLLTWTPTQSMILTHYFVFGKRVSEELKNNDRCEISNIHEIGPVRSDLLKACFENDGDMELSDYEKIALVLDFYSANNIYDNNKLIANNWKNNNKFYEDIVALAKLHENILFLIKGKNHDFINNKVFKVVVKKIQQQKNIKVITNYEKWSPYKCASIVDFAIALHTSLGDEMLACGKPVLFYDYFGFPTSFFDYDDYPFIVHNFSALKKEVARILSSSFLSDEDFAELRDNYYSIRDDSTSVRARLINKLNAIYGDLACET